MSLTERIHKPERPVDEQVERRVERRLPEWRRRAIEQHERIGFRAVVDLTRTAA